MFSFLGFLVIVSLLFWLVSLSNRVSVLEKKLKEAGAFHPSPTSAPTAEEYSAALKTPASAIFNHPAAASPLAAKPAPSEAQETEIAANWLTKIGVLALLFGVGFFLKYAIDKGWISQWARVLIGVATGGLLVILGELWKEKYTKYAAALTGGGIALLYFSIFASFQFYSLLPQEVAFALMVIITILAVALAYRYRSKPLAVLGVAGAYLSPLLMHAGIDQQIPLFVYLTILNLATLAILAKYFWMELAFLSLFGTMLDYIVWATNFSGPQNTAASIVFVCAVFAIFLLGGAILFRKHKIGQSLAPQSDYYFSVLSVLLGGFFACAVSALLFDNFHPYLAPVILLGATLSFIAYVFVDRLEFKKINYTLSFVGSSLLCLAAAWYFNGKTLDFMVIILGLFGVSIGALQKRLELKFWGLGILLISVILVLFTPYDLPNYTLVLNSKFGLMLAGVVALLVAGWLYDIGSTTDEERQASSLARVLGSMLLWFAFSWEIITYFRAYDVANTRNLLLSLWWIAYGVVLMVVGAAGGSKIFRKISIVLFGLSILKVFLYDVQALELGYRVVSFIVLGVILLSVSFGYQKNKEKITKFLEGEKEGIITNGKS